MPNFSKANLLDQALDIAGSFLQSGTKTLTDETAGLGQAVSGQTGVAASIVTGGAGQPDVTGLTGMTLQSVGRFLTISGADTVANNGTFLIVQYNSATSVRISNASAVTPDANNGSITWTERGQYTLQDDVNFARTDRAAIKGVGFDQAIPPYTRPTDTATSVPANLSNIAGKTTDAKALTTTRAFLAKTVASTNTFVTLTSVGNLKHATTVDTTGVPIQDGADAGVHEATYVEIINPETESSLEVLAGPDLGKRIYGRTRAGTQVAATGTITAVTGASTVDGDTFTISDGINTPTVFEFDSGGGVTGGNIAVAFTGGDSAATIAASIQSAINGVGATLLVTAGAPSGAAVPLTNDNVGSQGNVTITQTGVTGLTLAGMSGGSGSFSPNSVEVEFRAVSKGSNLSTSVAYTWEGTQPTTIDLYYGFRQRLDQLDDTVLRRVLVNGIVGDADMQQDIADVRETIGIGDNVTSLTGLLTNTGNFFPFVDLPDATPSVVEALNTLNEQIGDRDYTGTILTDGQTITASLQALANEIGAATMVRTIERRVADIEANTPHTLPGGITYTLDGTNNGRNMSVFWRGVLKDPGSVVNGDDYAETSTTSITPFSKIKAGDHISYFIYQ